MMTNKILCVIFLGCFAMLSGCVTPPKTTDTQFTAYGEFTAGPENGVDLVWATEELRDIEKLKQVIAEYDSVTLGTVVIFPGQTELNQTDIAAIKNYLIEKVTTALMPTKPVISQASERSLELNIAISNIEIANPVQRITSSVLPYGIVLSGISKLATGEHRGVGSATIELLVADAQTKEPLFAAIDRKAGNKDLGSLIDGLDDTRDAIDYWVDRLAVTLTNWQPPN